MTAQDMHDAISEMFFNRDTNDLNYILYGDQVSPGQEDIIDCITYCDNKRVVINCMTQYGKSFSVGKGIGDYILINNNKKVVIIAPTNEQTKIIMTYVFDNISKCSYLQELLPDSYESISDRLSQQASKRRIRFNNGCVLELKSAEGKGERLMGFGYDLVIIDEACLINQDVYESKILRLLTANPNAVLILIGNPWNRNNFFFKAFINPSYHKIHVDYKQALEEKRVTQEFIDEVRDTISPLHFKVLYESKFPTESEYQLIPLEHINQAINKRLKIDKGYKIVSSDIASMGNDFTVHIFAQVIGEFLFVYDIKHQSKKNPEQVAGTILSYFKMDSMLSHSYVDSVGIGEGVYANLVREKIDVYPIKAGMNPSNKGRDSGILRKFQFSNKKAELYWTLKEMFEQKKIFFSNDLDKTELRKLIEEITSIEWEVDRKGRICIIDHKKEAKSPDWADALAYMMEEVILGRQGVFNVEVSNELPQDERRVNPNGYIEEQEETP